LYSVTGLVEVISGLKNNKKESAKEKSISKSEKEKNNNEMEGEKEKWPVLAA